MLHMIGAVFVNRNRLPGLSENKISSIFLSRCIEQSVHYCVTDLLSYVGSRPSDHYFRSVCLFVCAEFFSAVFDPISIKLGHMLYVWVYLCPLEYRGCVTPWGWVTPKNLYF